jgi:hypothetical protein
MLAMKPDNVFERVVTLVWRALKYARKAPAGEGRTSLRLGIVTCRAADSSDPGTCESKVDGVSD